MGDANMSARVQIPRAEQQAAWLDDYIGGLSERAVAAKHGVSKTAVHNAIKLQLASARERRAGLADVLLDVQIARYTDLYRRCIEELDDSSSGREVGKAQLITAARGALDSLTRVLGLDNGITVNVHTETALDRELAALTARMGEVLDGTIDGEIEAPSDDDT